MSRLRNFRCKFSTIYIDLILGFLSLGSLHLASQSSLFLLKCFRHQVSVAFLHFFCLVFAPKFLGPLMGRILSSRVTCFLTNRSANCCTHVCSREEIVHNYNWLCLHDIQWSPPQLSPWGRSKSDSISKSQHWGVAPMVMNVIMSSCTLLSSCTLHILAMNFRLKHRDRCKREKWEAELCCQSRWERVKELLISYFSLFSKVKLCPKVMGVADGEVTY